jgi:hypothetical protein
MLHRVFFEVPWPRILWDETSREFFNPASVKCNAPELPAGLKQSHLVSLAGAPRDSRVEARVISTSLDLAVHSDLFEHPFTFAVIRMGPHWTARFDSLELKNEYRQRGIGARMFVLMVRAARRLGIRRLEARELHMAYAEGSAWSGALAAAKLGWDAELPADYIRSLPDYLGAAENLRELLLHPGGRDWWDRHPTQLRFTFDTALGSASMERLQAYTLEQGIRLRQ